MTVKPPIKIANCSGFYGDKLSAAKELVEGGPIDVLTGDYLAELTMAILFNQQRRSPEKGYVGTFIKQMRDVMEQCLNKNIKVVSNAGGLNPKGMAQALQTLADELGLKAKIAYIDGDDLMPKMAELQHRGEAFINMDSGQPLQASGLEPVTANAYLGCWGIKEALDQGADIVVCPRVTDAAVVIGPAAWYYNWQREDYDALAGALAAGHIIECGLQATGGNYAFFQDVPSFENMGYPIAEIAENGSCVITKHIGTGGLVSVGTVSAQLLYEIGAPEYLNPDVTAHFDTLQLEQVGDDRVRVFGCKGSAPPPSHKVCINTRGGYRNSMNLIVPGLDVELKAKSFETVLFNALGGKEQFDRVDVQLVRSDKESPNSNEEAFAILRIHVMSLDEHKVGRLFSAKVIELALANYPGFAALDTPGEAKAYIVYWPALISSDKIVERVHIDHKTLKILPTQQLEHADPVVTKPSITSVPVPNGARQSVALGRIYGARSGDKGGSANVGLWANSAEAYAFLESYLSVDEFKKLLPDLRDYDITRYELPNIFAVNFLVKDILGQGVSSSTRMDGQGKTLGEYIRAKIIQAPLAIIPEQYR